jgi:hypothetical protein
MRVSRGLEKLRRLLAKRGVTVPAAALGGLVSQAAGAQLPEGLAAAVQATSLGTAAVSGAVLSAMGGAMKTMMWLKVKLVASVVCAVAVVGGGGTLAVRGLVAGETGAASRGGNGADHRPNPKLAALPEATWVKVAPQVPAHPGIMYYSGAVFNPDANCLMLFGGGHNAYWGNEVWKLEMSTLKWTRMYEPTKYGKLNNDKGCVEGDDKPYTRHSYDHMVYVPTTREMLMWGGFGPTCYPRRFGGNLADKTGPRRGGVSPQPIDVWTYSLEKNKWKLRFNLPNKRENHKKAPSGPNAGTAYDSKRDLVWAVKDARAIHSFSLKANKWTPHKTAIRGEFNRKTQSAQGSLVYLPKRDLLMSASGWSFKPGKGAVSAEKLPAVGEVEGAKKPVYGSICLIADRELPFGMTVDLRTRYFDFEKKKWLEAPAKTQGGRDLMLGRGKKDGCIKGIYGRLRWAPVDGVVIMTIQGGTWAYRPPKKLGNTK